MMNRTVQRFFAGLALACVAAAAGAAPSPGAPAPGFVGTDSMGASVDLADFAGRKVILEWTNHDCPYVQKHYGTDNMQQLQRDMADEGVVWLTVISSAPGTQGHVSAEQANALTASRNAAPAHVILDAEGVIGRAYEARTTPHMFIIDEAQNVQYMGAIDDQPSARHSTVEGATNYVRNAYAALKASEPVNPASTQPYGCSVKYR